MLRASQARAMGSVGIGLRGGTSVAHTLFKISLAGIFLGSSFFGYAAGTSQAGQPDVLEREALDHIALTMTTNGYQLQYICHRRVYALRGFNDNGALPLFDETISPKEHGFIIASFGSFSNWAIAGATGSLTGALKFKDMARLVRQPDDPRSMRVIYMLAAGGTGAYLGYLVGRRGIPDCDSAELLKIAHQNVIWDRAKAGALFQLVQDTRWTLANHEPASHRVMTSLPGTYTGMSAGGIVDPTSGSYSVNDQDLKRIYQITARAVATKPPATASKTTWADVFGYFLLAVAVIIFMIVEEWARDRFGSQARFRRAMANANTSQRPTLAADIGDEDTE